MAHNKIALTLNDLVTFYLIVKISYSRFFIRDVVFVADVVGMCVMNVNTCSIR